MTDYNARKRLKKKMLDRWENEGGRVAAENNATDKGESKGPRPSAHRKSTSDDHVSQGQKRKHTHK